MLTVNDLVRDYDAVMSSVDHLRSTYSQDSGSDWPAGLTLEEDLVDLGWHQREFTLRISFAYTMMAPDESRCLGLRLHHADTQARPRREGDDVGPRRRARQRPR